MKRITATKLFIGIIFVLCFKTGVCQRFNTSSEIIGLIEDLEVNGKLVGSVNPDSLPSLPIGIHKKIGGISYTIAIDSARFQTNGAFFDAYMAIQLPGGRDKIAFRASNIQFNPKGVVGGALSKLKLVSEQTIEMGTNLSLILPGDGSNYVEWDCNGFKAVNLKGIFEFSEGLLIPIDSGGKVKAEFEVYCSDLSDILIRTSISPFKIKGAEKFEFHVQNASVDLSDLKNPQGAIFPNHYHEVYPEDINLWRGFYLESVEVKLPEALSKSDERMSIGVNDLFIDDSGFSGEVFAKNLISINEGDMSGWSFSVSDLNVDFVNNKLVGGGIKGKVGVPVMDDAKFEYTAEVYQNETGSLDYNFVVSIDEAVTINAFSSRLTLDPGTQLQIQIIENKFLPKLVASGRLSVEKGKTEVNMVTFQNITFETHAPYITNGVFALTSNEDSGDVEDSENQMESFSISLEEFSILFSETAPVLALKVRMNIGKKQEDDDESGFSLSVAAGFKLYAKITEIPNPQSEGRSKLKWSLDRFVLNTIELEVATNAFELKGSLSFRKSDPIYGDGIFGSISLLLKDVLPDPITITAMFGRIEEEDYRYWLFDINVPVYMLISPPGIVIRNIRGGVAFHVEDTRTKEQLIASANDGAYVGPNVYVPNKDLGLSFKVGVGFDWSNEKILNADVLFSITFNSHGGLDNVYFLGKAFMMVSRSDRNSATNKVEGTILVYYDNVEKILDAQLEVDMEFAGIVKGNLNVHFFLSPDLWFFKLNTPSNPANINLLDFAFIDTYLMVGQDLEPMQPPPPMVMSLVGIENTSSRNEEAILLGNGFAHGSRLDVVGEFEVGWENFSIYAGLRVGAGYDVTMYNYGPGAHCEGMSGPIGMKGWYLQGQVYSYIGIGIGIRGRILGGDFDVPILEAQLAMYLAAKLPKPTFVEGGVGVSATVLGVLPVSFHLNFSLGDDCNIVNT